MAKWSMHSAQANAFALQNPEWNNGRWTYPDGVKRWMAMPAGRRWGKTEHGVMRTAAWSRDLSLRGVNTVAWIIAPTYDLLRPIWRKYLRIVPKHWITKKHGSEERPNTIHIGNVTIEFRSGDNPERLVAEGVAWVWLDESGTLKQRVWRESVLPALADHSAPALMTGTPKGRNWFHESHIKGRDNEYPKWGSVGGSSYENPYIPKSDIDEIAAELPERAVRQEIFAEFLEDEGAVFRKIRQALGPYSDRPPVVLGVDLAKHQDFTVIHGLDEFGHTCSWERFRKLDWPFQKRRIIRAAKKGNRPLVAVDATHGSVGDPIADDLHEEGLKVEPVQFTSTSKRALVEGLQIAIEDKLIRLPEDEPVLRNELEVFEYEMLPSGRLRYQAPEGLHDDAVMAAALAWYGYTIRNKYRVPDVPITHY